MRGQIERALSGAFFRPRPFVAIASPRRESGAGRPSWPPRTARRGCAGLLRIVPAGPARDGMPRPSLHAAGPARLPPTGWDSACAAILSYRPSRRAALPGASLRRCCLSSGAQASRPNAVPWKARWRSPAGWSGPHAFPRECAPSPRGRTLPPGWMAISLPSCPARLSRGSFFPASISPPWLTAAQPACGPS